MRTCSTFWLMLSIVFYMIFCENISLKWSRGNETWKYLAINFPWKSVFAFWLLPPTKIPSNQLRGKIWIFSSQKKHCMVAFKKVKIWGGTALSFLNRIKFCLVNCLEHSTMTLTVKNSLQFSKNKDFFKVVLFGMYSTFESVSQKQFYNLYNSETNLLPALECLVVVVWW